MNVLIREMEPADWVCVADIYAQGIRTGDATFATEVPTWDAWDAARRPTCRLVATVSGDLIGFAALSPVSPRPVYAGVAEVMVYVAEGVRGRGVGRRLMDALVRCSETEGIWTLQAGIFIENQASVALHEAVGFRILGTHQGLGRFHDGRWRDVLRLERRSQVVGLD